MFLKAELKFFEKVWKKIFSPWHLKVPVPKCQRIKVIDCHRFNLSNDFSNGMSLTN